MKDVENSEKISEVRLISFMPQSISTLQTSNCKVRNWGIGSEQFKVTRCTWSNDNPDRHQLRHQTEYCDNMGNNGFQTDSIFPQALGVLRNYRHPLKFTKPNKCCQPWLDHSSEANHTFLVTPYPRQNGNRHFQNWFVTVQLPVSESVHISAIRLWYWSMGTRPRRPQAASVSLNEHVKFVQNPEIRHFQVQMFEHTTWKVRVRSVHNERRNFHSCSIFERIVWTRLQEENEEINVFTVRNVVAAR